MPDLHEIVEKLSPLQKEAPIHAEDTLYGDTKFVPGYGRSLCALKRRGLAEGERPHVYLTDDGRDALQLILNGQTA